MDSSFWLDAINLGWSYTYLMVSGYNFQKILYSYCLNMKIVSTFTNSVDFDEKMHYAAFHLGLHCLPKYSFRGFLNTVLIFHTSIFQPV